MQMSRRTMAKGIGGVAAAGLLARHADSSLAQATPVAGPSVATAETVAAAIDQLESLITGAEGVGVVVEKEHADDFDAMRP